MITRRDLLAGILGACAAPAIVTRSGILMPVKTIALPQPWWITAELPQTYGGYFVRVSSASDADVAQEISAAIRRRVELGIYSVLHAYTDKTCEVYRVVGLPSPPR